MTSTSRPRPHPSVLFFAALVIQELLYLFLPGVRFIPGPWNLVGVAPIAVGVALHATTSQIFARHGTTRAALGEPSVLVVDGPFQWTRNPMYLAGVVILLGTACVLGCVTPFLVIPLFAALVRTSFIRVEERMLAERFGEEYEAYRNRVRRWL
jgi:protein-S-isoprenylcysteine O-methyltransferase Ste14